MAFAFPEESEPGQKPGNLESLANTLAPAPHEGNAHARAAPARPVRDALRRLNRRLRRWLAVALIALFPLGPGEPVPAEEKVKRVLLIRANFRIGNVILATSLLPAIQARFPQARIDWLVGDTTAALLRGLPVGEVHQISRSFIWAPWRLVRLFLQLRRQVYDVAVDAAITSFSGALYAWLSGARHRVGVEGRNSVWFTSRLAMPRACNAYAKRRDFAAALGIESDARPVYQVRADEAAAADQLLRRLQPTGAATAPVGVFIGGHRDKRWPINCWRELVARLSDGSEQVLVFVGPEESCLLPQSQGFSGRGVAVVPPQPVRVFAALLARTRILVTPDSGPMHLAAALRVPVVAVLQKEGSRRYVPPGATATPVRPTVADVLQLVTSHAAWAPVEPYPAVDAKRADVDEPPTNWHPPAVGRSRGSEN